MNFHHSTPAEKYTILPTLREQELVTILSAEEPDQGTKVLLFHQITQAVEKHKLSLAETAVFLFLVSPYGTDRQGRRIAGTGEIARVCGISAPVCQKIIGRLTVLGLIVKGGKLVLGTSYTAFQAQAGLSNKRLPRKSRKQRKTTDSVIGETVGVELGEDDRWRETFFCLGNDNRPEGTLEVALYWFLLFSTTIYGDLEDAVAQESVADLARQWKARSKTVLSGQVATALDRLHAKGLLKHTTSAGTPYLAVLNAVGRNQLDYRRSVSPNARIRQPHVDMVYHRRHQVATLYKEQKKARENLLFTRIRVRIPNHPDYGKHVCGTDARGACVVLTEAEIDDIHAGLLSGSRVLQDATSARTLLIDALPPLIDVAAQVAHSRKADATMNSLGLEKANALCLAILCREAGVPVPAPLAETLCGLAKADSELTSACILSNAGLSYLIASRGLLESVASYEDTEGIPGALATYCRKLVDPYKKVSPALLKYLDTPPTPPMGQAAFLAAMSKRKALVVT